MKHLIALIALGLFLPAAHAELFISNTLVTFNETPVDGYGKSTNVFVQNLNTKAVQITVNNACFDNFYVNSACNVTLEPNKVCNIAIRFQPFEFGQLSCSIAIQDSLGDSGMIKVSGRGVQPN